MTTETDRPSGTSHTKTDTKAESGPGSGTVATPSTRAPNSWGLGDGQAIPWEYAPAPESRDIVRIRARYGLFIGGREVPASDGATFTTVDPATEQPLAEVARATRPTSTRRSGPRAGRPARRWGQLPGRERAKYLFRIARILQERSREFAVLETWTRASRSRRAATSTSRSRPPTSGTTRAGRTSSITRSPAGSRGRSAWPPR